MDRVHLARRVVVTLTAGAALVLAGHAGAATLTPIPSYVDPAGGRTSVLGVNDALWMTGSVTEADGSAHGFVRNAAGVYTLFDLGSRTFGRAIDNSNRASGYTTDATDNLHTGQEFTRAADGTITILQHPPGTDLHGIAQGMNASGAIAGDYYPGAGATHDGFILDGGTFTDLSIAATSVRARAITDAGEVAGWVTDAGGSRAFLLNGGVYSFFNAPGAVNGTFFEDLNNNGIAVGEYNDAANLSHAFTFNTFTDTFTNIVVPGATNVQAFGLNDHNQVVLTTDIASGPNNFLLSLSVPEPSTWAMMLTGFAGLGAVLRRRRLAVARAG